MDRLLRSLIGLDLSLNITEDGFESPVVCVLVYMMMKTELNCQLRSLVGGAIERMRRLQFVIGHVEGDLPLRM